MPASNSDYSLTNFAKYGRLAVIYGLIGLVVLIVGRSLLSTSVSVFKALNPPPTPGPTMGFGYLPKPAFPNQIAEDRPTSYRLDTVGQTLPNFGTQVPVYFMPSAQPNLLALDSAKETAASLGFVFAPEKISAEEYRWRRSTPIPATLEMNIVTKHLDLDVDWASSVSLLDKKNVPTPEQLTLETRSLLRSANLLPADIATASPDITYIRALGGELQPVSSVSEADFVRVDIFRLAPNDFPTVTSEQDRGVIRVLFSGSREQGERVLRLESDYSSVDWSNFETYPLQSAQLAWQALQAGEGFIVTPPRGDEAVIREVTLAYYEPTQLQNYYQPVYVFSGDDNFRAYVPALDSRIYNTN
ncbi:hypothetical protein LRY64_03000 [Candidatus Woesebacteria bacterium]|nr:hypothetical protein [Candidatus Woesebacteria bacterium]